MARKGKGAPPARSTETLSQPVHPEGGYPVLSLRHLQSGYGVEELTHSQCSAFLIKWAKRSQHTWTELVQHGKHGLGSELMPKTQIKKTAPEHLARDKYMVIRHEGNLPVVGFRAGDIFYALWIEAAFGDVYDH